MLSKPLSKLILAFRIIVLSSCMFLAYNYHSECLENSLHTLMKSHIAEIQTLEATYIFLAVVVIPGITRYDFRLYNCTFIGRKRRADLT